MNCERKKIGILTFHASYNCGSMLQAYALQYYLNKHGYQAEIIDFSSLGQKKLYTVFSQKKDFKRIVKNIVLLPHKKHIEHNYACYEHFKKTYFNLTDYSTDNIDELRSDGYYAVIAGADQIWNITISDYDDSYFLPWVKNSLRIAYAPSFGAKDPKKYTDDIEKYKNFLNSFDSLSIREKNGRKWIKELIGKTVPVVLDPTLLIDSEDYNDIISDKLKLPEKYIFYYSPCYSADINKLVKKISKKYDLPVIAFNTKSFVLRGMNFGNFTLPEFENPCAYLQLMKNAELVITTSFHGTIFSTVFRRNFWTVKNGEMFGDDDRVATLMEELNLKSRLIPANYDPSFDYMKNTDYSKYKIHLDKLRAQSEEYLKLSLGEDNDAAE